MISFSYVTVSYLIRNLTMHLSLVHSGYFLFFDYWGVVNCKIIMLINNFDQDSKLEIGLLKECLDYREKSMQSSVKHIPKILDPN